MSNIIERSSQVINRFIRDREDRKFLPSNPLVDDIYLVSFPKSGNHWLRFLIANAIKTHYKIDREVNFFSIDDIIPNIHVTLTNLRYEGPFGRSDLPRIIKSHRNYTPYYNRVILLIRDPRDVMISYYHFLRDRRLISQNLGFSDFIRHPRYGAKAWSNHTKSWYLNFKPGQNIQVFRYEDFLTNTNYQLAHLMNLLGIMMKQNTLDEAIDFSSKENMKRSDSLHRSIAVTKLLNAPLVRQGNATKGKELSELDKNYIEDTTKEIAQMVGYVY